ncbi:MAG TPA: MFS transporter [Mycobacteriales bacterium]|nr:MFS transporter [Mycobacteriales bacterium]
MGRIVEAVAPARLGPGFRWLLGSAWVSNLGDGFSMSAGPLLVASQSHDPRLVALALLLQQLPYLLFGLFAGVLSDRVNRRAIVVTVDLLRAVVLGLLSFSVVDGVVNIGLVLGAMFLLGTAEVFGNNAFQTLLPMLVSRSDLAIANARVQSGLIVLMQLTGPAVGAALFAAGRSVPFVSQAVLVAAGAFFASRIGLPSDERPPQAERHVGRDIAEGVRWTLRHPAVRTLVLTIFIFNVTFGAAWSVLVLYARQRLGLGSIGFGLLTTTGALGGIAGTLSYGWITRRLSLGNIMRIGLILETFTHLGLALTTMPAVAMAIFFVFGAHAFIWGTTSITVRQRAVPIALQGRVGSVNGIGTFGGMVIGAALGGVIAGSWGITAPFWFAFAGSGVFVILIWRQLRHIAHDDDPAHGATSDRASPLTP